MRRGNLLSGAPSSIPAAYWSAERQALRDATEYPVERYWRDARLTKIFEGRSRIQMRIISDGHLPRPKW